MKNNLCNSCGNWDRCKSRYCTNGPVYDCLNYFNLCQPSLDFCPKCKSKMIRIKIVSENQGMDGHCYNWVISCGDCGIRVQYPADAFYGREFYTLEQAIAEWNKRG